MSDVPGAFESTLSAEELEHVDHVCDRFEKAWLSGERPELKSFMEDLRTSAGKVLLRELLKIELDYRGRNGERPTVEEYEALFPEHSDLIAVFFDSIGPCPADGELPGYGSAPSTAGQTAPVQSGGTRTRGLESKAGKTWPRIHGFEIVSELGRGAMGVVYRARHERLDMQVAIKVMLPGAAVERFVREARLLARIKSPHVVAVYNFDVLPDGSPMLVMEWVEGTDLRKLIRGASQGLPEEKVLPWMRHACEGMLAAAEHGIIHRDLKPSNMLIDGRGIVRVADFGLARAPTSQADLSISTGIMGTPHYMAPEQAEDPRSVDTRADIYSFGATFYHALTGKPPFEGGTAFSILYKHKTEPLISPRARNRNISERTTELLERCLAKSPQDRFSSFSEVLKYLLPTAGPVSPWTIEDDPESAPYWTRFQARRAAYLSGQPAWKESEMYKFPRGQILKIFRDTIVEQEVDAIVSSDTHYLTMDYGVSQAIRLAAGPRLVEEAKRLVPVLPGRAVVTSGGTLRARFIFHGVTIGALSGDPTEEITVSHDFIKLVLGRWVLPSRDLISEIMSSCFYHADTLQVRSIAFPLLGTGGAGFSREVCLETMFRFLVRMFLRGLTSVREARLVLFD